MNNLVSNFYGPNVARCALCTHSVGRCVARSHFLLPYLLVATQFWSPAVLLFSTTTTDNMRVQILHIPYLSLVLLPFIIAHNGHGFFGTLFWMILWAAVRQAIVIYNIKT